MKIVLRRKNLLLSSAAFAAFSLPAFAQTPPVLPGGGQVAAGQATIGAPVNNTLTINQSSQAAIIGWQSFSIGQGGTVQFNNGSGATLNRVTGNVPSQIDGLLSATGSVYLVNPAGVAVGTSGRVATGGSFIASTQDVSNAEFMAGKSMTFRGTSEASVVNYGRIGSLGGDVALIARQVENHGSISAPKGTAALAAGYEVLMRDASLSDGKFMVQIGGAGTAATTTGRIKAAEVELRANGGNVYALAGNTQGVTKATGIANKGGRIFLTAGSGSVTVSQRIVARKSTGVRTASGKRVGDGGEINVLGKTVTLAGATLDASGATGGGTIRVGGGWQGQGDVPRAQTVTIDSSSVLRADAIVKGDGGTVVVWSDQKTSFAGIISARGGSEGGNGGNAEVSGKALLDYTGFTTLSAAKGAFGNLLLDPYNVVISSGTDSLGSGPGFTANANDSVINATTLQTALSGANVTISTGSGGAQTGDITVNAAVSWSSGSKLTLDAYHSIAINAPITVGGAGGLDLTINNGGSGGTLTFAGGVQYTGAPNSGQSLTINSQPYTLLYSMSDVQAINNNLGGRYALAKPLDATGVTGWTPLGTDGVGNVLNGSQGFAGTFTGLGNTISNLMVDIGSSMYAGLFGWSKGDISDVGLVGGSVKGGNYVGGLVGLQYGSSITQAYATGTVTGGNNVGGLVGHQAGSIIQSYATGAVTGTDAYVGGLVGYQVGDITQSYATGAVRGRTSVGGLVGWQYGSITQSYATGAVTGTGDYVGGLVGVQYDTITQSYATGAVTGIGASVGGLVGSRGNVGILIFNSYFDSYSTGRAASNGVGNVTNASGVTAVTSDLAQAGAANYAYKQSAYSNLTFTTTPGGSGWYMIDGQTRPFGAWEYSTAITNAHQLQLVNMDLNASYTLARSIDLAGAFSAAGIAMPTPAQTAGMWRGGFVPLGTDGASNILNGGKGFAGTFDGLGNTISNFAVDIGNNDYAGLFGYSSGAISNFGLVGGSVRGLYYVGGLVGYQYGGSIMQSYATGAVTGSLNVGGLVGYQYGGSIMQSYATGAVTGSGTVGGLVGDLNSGSITQAYATGKVEGGSNVGGLVGRQFGGITQSYATGAVTGSGTVGGLVGYQVGNIEQSYATGAVTSTGDYVGGLVGRQVGGTITQSYATGAVTGSDYVGGLVGYQNSGTITQSYATGAVTGLYYVGGLVGLQFGGITQSYATSAVTGTGNLVGGLVGYQYGGSIMQSYATGAVTSTGDDVGGLVGAQGSGNITQAYATGKVEGGSNVGGLVGSQFGGITQSYATGAVSGNDRVGGLVGYQVGNIEQSYATGAVTGSDYVGGLVGYRDGTITASYFDSSSTGRAASNGVGNIVNAPGVTALSSADGSAFVKANYVGFDWTVWSPPSAAGGSNPAYRPELFGVSGVVGVDYGSRTATYGDVALAFGIPTVYGVGYFNTWTATPGGGSFASTNVGTYAIGSSSGAAAAFTPGGASRIVYLGTLTITPATLTLTANAASKVYGDADPALTYAASGFKFSDTESSVLTGDLVRASGKNVGTYLIGQGTLAASANYTIAYTGANFDITPRSLTVTAAGQNKVYDGTTAASVTYGDNRVVGDTLTIGGTASFGDKNVGTGKAVTVSGIALGGADAGNYTVNSTASTSADITARALTVTASGQDKVYDGATTASVTYGDNRIANDDLTVGGTASFGDKNVGTGKTVSVSGIVLGGMDASNYTVNSTAMTAADITPRSLTVTASGQDKVYDGTTAASVTFGDNRIANDDLTIAGTAVFGDKNVGAGKTLSVAGITLGGADAGNYTFNTTATATADITARPVTVTADAQQKVTAQPDPALTWQVTSGNLVNGDALSGSLTRAAGETAGSYAITQGTLSASTNYALSFVGNTLVIVPAPVQPSNPSFDQTASQPPTVFEHGQQGGPSGLSFFLSSIAEVERAAADNDRTKSLLPSGCASGLLAGQCAGFPHPDNLNFGVWLSVSAN